MKTQKVQTDFGPIEVSKLPLGRYADLLKAIKNLPKHATALQGKSNNEIIDNLPTLIADSLPDIIGILEISTSLKKDQIEQMGLDDVVKIVVAVIEVNNYRDIYNQIKKVTAQPAQITK
jgi:hypothetical protein